MQILHKAINLDHFLKKIRHGALLMLDYDGTLAPFVQDRMQAVPYPGIKERLQKLAKLKHSRTMIVSGRALSDLEKLLEIYSGLELWGSHGLERKLPDGKTQYTQMTPLSQEGLELAVKACLESTESKYCELKPYGVALHWRGMDSDAKQRVIQKVEPQWERIGNDFNFEILHFDGGLELRPKGRNKGDVVMAILQELPSNYAIAYLGDDATDEDAFKALGERGLKILVRDQDRPTLADVRLIPPAELLAFLDKWIERAT